MQGVFTLSGKLKDEALFTLAGKDGTQTGGCLQTGDVCVCLGPGFYFNREWYVGVDKTF